ncbi:phosphotransferase enzyme family protein [Actinoplanes sp. NPDC049681]|uniref:phosphotransferase enzyme family protein n=1 Tax=Actinoplanes sp. NPDC049681 TaxID=3363905 RepID=UPI0037AF0150
MDTLHPLDSQNARSALVVACAAVGLDPSDAELIRIGSNGVFRLRHQPVVARVTRDVDHLDAVRREIAVSRWLAAGGVPAVRALGVPQPLIAEGRAVTLWESVSDSVEYGTTVELASILRRLHGLELPANFLLPRFDPLPRLSDRIERSAALTAADRRLLDAMTSELSSAYEKLRFELPEGPIHGDANVGNLLRSQTGDAVLSDLDEFSVGPREWDLTLTAMYFERYGWHTEAEYHGFCAGYGWDVMEWTGYGVLADIKELMMVTWLAQGASDGKARQELAQRLDTLRTGEGRKLWKPF